MKHLRQRNARIAEELILFCYRHKANNINLNINHEKNHTKIIIEARGAKIDNETILVMEKLLNVPRSTEMEEYYWNLTGESDIDCELSIIGTMCDSAKIRYQNENETLKIELIRNE